MPFYYNERQTLPSRSIFSASQCKVFSVQAECRFTTPNVSQLCHVNLGHCLRGRESEVNEQNLLRVVIYCRELLKRRKLSSLAPAGKS